MPIGHLLTLGGNMPERQVTGRIDFMTWLELSNIAPVECEILDEELCETDIPHYVKDWLQVDEDAMPLLLKHSGFHYGEIGITPVSWNEPIFKMGVFIRVSTEAAYEINQYVERERSKKEEDEFKIEENL